MNEIQLKVILGLLIAVGVVTACAVPTDEDNWINVSTIPLYEATKITKYRLNYNKILYDVILRDGSRCVVSTGGGTYCEFKHDD